MRIRFGSMLIVWLCCFLPIICLAGTYKIMPTDSYFDGNTDCNGACGGDDTIYIESGTRSILNIKNVVGSANDYVTFVNRGWAGHIQYVR